MIEEEAAQYLRCSTKTLQRRRRNGQIAFIRDGHIKYLRSDLDSYLEARRSVATTLPPPTPKPKYRPCAGRGDANREALHELL